MSIATRITSIENHIEQSYKELKGLGVDITNVNKNLENIPKLLDGYWETLPKVTGNGTNITLDDTKEAKMKLELLPDTQQSTSILPNGYTQVDYIQSDGNQYIDINYIPTNNTKWVLDAQYIDTSASPYIAYNGRYDGTVNPVGQRFDIASERGYFVLNGGLSTPTNYQTDFVRHTFVVDMVSGKGYIDNNEYNLSTQTFNSTRSLYLFARHANTTEYKSTMKLFSCKFYESNVLSVSLIPCYRNSDNEVGLYDIVNNTFYTNDGTGAFTYGSVVSIPNPEFPIPIQVVTGNQTITISNSDDTQSQTYNLTLGSLEYCKIGDYSDRIFKNIVGDTDYDSTRELGKWYIKKNIGKVVLNEATALYTYNNMLGANFANVIPAKDTRATGMCNRSSKVGKYYSQNSIWVGATDRFIYWVGILDVLGLTTLEQFNNWLSNHNTIIYYVLTTPTYELLNNTLQEQLNTLENAMSYNTQTNVNNSGDLASILNANALQDLSEL